MNWNLDNLTPREALAVQRGYVAAFCSVFLPRLKAMEPPKIETAPPPSPDTDAQPPNTYIPLAHQK
jgi:hypothetical protein